MNYRVGNNAASKPCGLLMLQRDEERGHRNRILIVWMKLLPPSRAPVGRAAVEALVARPVAHHDRSTLVAGRRVVLGLEGERRGRRRITLFSGDGRGRGGFLV